MRMASTIQRAAGAITAFATGRSRHRYQTLPLGSHGDLDDVPIEQRRKTPPRRSTFRRDIALIVLSFLCILGMGYWVSTSTSSTTNGEKSCDDPDKGYVCKTDQSHHWGQYAPYFTVSSSIPREVPDECKITFAQILSRHGARDPTAEKTARYRELITHIQQTARKFPGIYTFLATYRYSLGADQLTEFGEQQMVNSGLKFYKRYQSLAKTAVPFIRSAGQERVVKSAENWSKGFHQGRAADEAASVLANYPYDIVVIPEGEAFNNTLSHDTCPNFNSDPGSNAQKTFASTFTPRIVKRINKGLGGVDLGWEQAIQLMDLCPFESVATPLGTVSSFCRMFSSDDWLDYGYYQTLGKYYGFADGNSLGAAQGIGFVNELIARMTVSPVIDHTNTNSTLDGSEETFPIGKTSLYADFSHDNDISGILAALDLYKTTDPPPPNKRLSAQDMAGYAASWTVPFASRAYFEKMKCPGETEEFVRVVVNDRVMPLESCGGDRYGRCTLSKFVDSLSFAQNGGNWDDCF